MCQDKRSGGKKREKIAQNIPFKDDFANSLLRDQRYWKLLSYKEKIRTHLFDPLQNRILQLNLQAKYIQGRNHREKPVLPSCF